MTDRPDDEVLVRPRPGAVRRQPTLRLKEPWAGRAGKVEIVIELEPPAPEPPDGECPICAGVVPGWRTEARGAPVFCAACESAKPNMHWPAFRGLSPVWERVHRLGYAVEAALSAAGTALWHLEQEIARQG